MLARSRRLTCLWKKKTKVWKRKHQVIRWRKSPTHQRNPLSGPSPGSARTRGCLLLDSLGHRGKGGGHGEKAGAHFGGVGGRRSKGVFDCGGGGGHLESTSRTPACLPTAHHGFLVSALMMTPPTADGDPDLLFICSDGEEQQKHLMGEDQQVLR